jgi:hypothetical protein
MMLQRPLLPPASDAGAKAVEVRMREHHEVINGWGRGHFALLCSIAGQTIILFLSRSFQFQEKLVDGYCGE